MILNSFTTTHLLHFLTLLQKWDIEKEFRIKYHSTVTFKLHQLLSLFIYIYISEICKSVTKYLMRRYTFFSLLKSTVELIYEVAEIISEISCLTSFYLDRNLCYAKSY